jgi:hypothetical protein
MCSDEGGDKGRWKQNISNVLRYDLDPAQTSSTSTPARPKRHVAFQQPVDAAD